MLAAYQAWFGAPGHIDVGYNSLDPGVLANQIEKAKQLGIQGFVVNWYGSHGSNSRFEDRSYSTLQHLAVLHGFKTAIQYDEDPDPSRSTEGAITDFQYAYQHYIGPSAPDREAYLTFNGRPMIFIFPKEGHTDWRRVREALSDWEEPPLLIDKDIRSNESDVFDGFYAWVRTHPDPNAWGEQYLDSFYSTMSNRYPNKIAVGAAWPGFNDSKAGWSRHRYMSPRCGKTFEDTLRLYRRYYNDSRPLPFLMIDTWNDYEEGTAIERGIGQC